MGQSVAVLAWIAAGVLVWAGGAKLIATRGVSAAGLVEVAVGGSVLGLGGRAPALALAAAYAVITLVAVRLRRAGSACDCLGAEGGTVTRAHVAIDVIATFAATAAIVTAPPPLVSLLSTAVGMATTIAVAAAAGAVVSVLGARDELRTVLESGGSAP
jgi:hypothetical protein